MERELIILPEIIIKTIQFLLRKRYARVSWWVPLVEQDVPTPQEHLTSPSVFSGVRTARTYVFCVMFCRSLFVLFGHCIVCPSIYGFWLISSDLYYSSINRYLDFKEQITIQFYLLMVGIFISSTNSFVLLSAPFSNMCISVMTLHTSEVCSEWRGCCFYIVILYKLPYHPLI